MPRNALPDPPDYTPVLAFAQAAIGTIGEYTTSGIPVNSALIAGLNAPVAIAISGSNLFVANLRGGTIGEYTTSGATVNASLITGLINPVGIAVFESELFVASINQTIGEYTTSGVAVNPSLITGLGSGPWGIAVVPEPGTGLLVTIGALGLAVTRRRGEVPSA